MTGVELVVAIRNGVADVENTSSTSATNVRGMCDVVEGKLTGDETANQDLEDWQKIKDELEALKTAVNETITLVCDQIETYQN